MTPQATLKALLTATAISGVFALLEALRRQRAAGADGWRHLTPGPMMWFALLGGAGMSGLLAWIYLFVGSARADAATQMMYLLWLDLAFILMTLVVAFSMIVESVRWDDQRLERRTLALGHRSLSWSDLKAFGHEPLSNYLWVSGRDGTRIRFSPYSNGLEELVEKILEDLPPPGSSLGIPSITSDTRPPRR